MAGIDEGRVYGTYQGLESVDAMGQEEINSVGLVNSLKKFINQAEPLWDVEKSNSYYYRDQLYHNKTKLLVDLEHVRLEDAELASKLEEKPGEILPLFEQAAAQVLRDHYAEKEEDAEDIEEGVQVMLCSTKPLAQSQTRSIRDLQAEQVSRLVMVSGIITAASKPRHKGTHLTLQCKDCKGVQTVACRPGLGGVAIPRYCSLNNVPGAEKCSNEPFSVIPGRSKYVDQQTLKLQEAPEDVPTGELPRTVQVLVDRHLMNKATPGTRVNIVGIYSTFRSGAMDKGTVAVQQAYIRATSMIEEAGDSHSRFNFTQQEIAEFERFAKQERVHEQLFARVAPNIFGSDDIKKAVAALLFGGARKTLPDGTNRRGDINVLLLGDPSTAKSQFLKFASKVAPISVYTSGKGSSAAGLTASVVQDPGSREFFLEGGAMVLADNGVVCIDEFDKMRPEDRVAIHEAMEQQTISIAKAGITTMLKSRTSVLAAANPPSGRYDDLKSAQDNIDLQSTILSRFDLIFIVKDPACAERDRMIARKVLDNHRGAGAKEETQDESTQEVYFLKRYIHYCRTQCFPRLSEQAQDRLSAYYVEIRGESRAAAEREDSDNSPIPVTVRQMEALIRLSESFAKMALQTVATLEHVEMAIQLFTKATMDAVKSGLTSYNIAPNESQREQIKRLEEKIKRRMHIGSYMTQKKLVDEMVAVGENERSVARALLIMSQRGDLKFSRERAVLHRIK